MSFKKVVPVKVKPAPVPPAKTKKTAKPKKRPVK